MFVSVKFHPDATRTYTYSFAGHDHLEPGMRVYVDTPKDGRKIVFVEDVDVPKPSFACKPIIEVAYDDDDSGEDNQ